MISCCVFCMCKSEHLMVLLFSFLDLLGPCCYGSSVDIFPFVFIFRVEWTCKVILLVSSFDYQSSYPISPYNLQEKHREKKHKKGKRDKEKKEKRDKEGRDGKRKEKKDKKEKHREKKKDKDKNRDKEKSKTGAAIEKEFPGQAQGPNAGKLNS